MKFFIIITCFLILHCNNHSAVSLSSNDFFLADEDNTSSFEDSSPDDDNIDELDEEFKDIRQGFGDIVDTDDDEEEVEEEEDLVEDDHDDKDDSVIIPTESDLDLVSPVDTSRRSRIEGCSCSNESFSILCECFGQSVKSIPKNMTGVTRL